MEEAGGGEVEAEATVRKGTVVMKSVAVAEDQEEEVLVIMQIMTAIMIEVVGGPEAGVLEEE